VGNETPVTASGGWGVGSIKAVLRMGFDVFLAVKIRGEFGLAVGVYVLIRVVDKEVVGRGLHGGFAGMAPFLRVGFPALNSIGECLHKRSVANR
jgi:hypothetical protein